jgi:stearoyl-CoA desaturase (delta-9 desaturase)
LALRALHRRRVLHVVVVAFGMPLGAAVAIGVACARGVEPVAVALFLLFYGAAAVGICVGYHRYFTHRGFRAGPVVRATLACLGATAGQGPLAYWVALHREHHEHSDRAGDPHSPHVSKLAPLHGWAGFWHAHMG